MRCSWSCICSWMLLTFPIPIATLVLQPHTNLSQPLTSTQLPEIPNLVHTGGIQAATPLTAFWCRPRSSELDLLFTTKDGKSLPISYLLAVLSASREVVETEARKHGKGSRCPRKVFKITLYQIVLKIWDDRLDERTWDDIHDLLDILLLCVYLENIATETTGTFFYIESKQRLASIAILRSTKGEANGGIASS